MDNISKQDLSHEQFKLDGNANLKTNLNIFLKWAAFTNSKKIDDCFNFLNFEKLGHLNFYHFKCVLIVLGMSFQCYAQDAITISPSGTESLKFSNSFKEKITFNEDNPNSKIGIGTSTDGGGFFRYLNFYVPTSGAFLFGSGSLNSFNEQVRITGNGKIGIGVNNPTHSLEVKGSIRIRSVITPYIPTGLYFKNVKVGLPNFPPDDNNTFIGVDTANNFIISSHNAVDHIFLTGLNSPTQQESLRIKGNGNLEIAGIIKNESEKIPVFQNTWINYGGGYIDGTYYKDKEKRVHLNGAIRATSNVNSSTIFVLPLGYRPSGYLTFNVDAFFGTSVRILIYPSGEVVYYSKSNNAGGEYNYVSLNGISFRVN